MTDPAEATNGTHAASDDGADDDRPTAVEAAPSSRSPMPFEGLDAPRPTPAQPPTGARWLAFGSILVGGLLGGLIGYGTADVMASSPVLAAAGGLIGAVVCAAGVGIVAGLTLRAMNEWHAVNHPEAAGDRATPGARRTGSRAR